MQLAFKADNAQAKGVLKACRMGGWLAFQRFGTKRTKQNKTKPNKTKNKQRA
jgi:hypothetical protein